MRSQDERPPRDGEHLELMEARFSHVRSFAPQVLGALTFAASVAPIDAVQLLQAMNLEGRRHVPDDAPIEFIPVRWRSYLDAARHAGTRTVLSMTGSCGCSWLSKAALRSGEIWVKGSRR